MRVSWYFREEVGGGTNGKIDLAVWGNEEVSFAEERRGRGRRTDGGSHDTSDTSKADDERLGDGALGVREDVVGRVGEDGGNVGCVCGPFVSSASGDRSRRRRTLASS